jgi:hypothetical protein
MKHGALLVAALLAALIVNISMATTLNVSPSNTASTPGWGTTQFKSIQTAINTASANDIITIATGTYSESLTISKPLSLIGTDMSLVVIDISVVGGTGILSTTSDLTLKNFTLIGDIQTTGGYGLKLQGVKANTSAAAQDGQFATGLVLENLTVQDAYLGPIDLNGINGATLTNVTASGSPKGVGIGITDCRNITMSIINTYGNYLSGMRMTANGVAFPGGIDHIVFGPGIVSTEPASTAYSEIDNAAYHVTNLDFSASDLKFRALKYGNATVGYTTTASQAINGIIFDGNNGALADINANNFYVTGGLKIQNAIKVALPGATLNIDAGTYAETVTIDKNLSFAPVAPSFDVVTGQYSPRLFVQNLVINTASGFTLTSMLGVNGNLTLTNGNLYTNGSSVTLATASNLIGETSAKMVIGDLIIRRTILAGATETFGGIGLEVSAAPTDLGQVRIIRSTGDAAAITAGLGKSIKRQWEIYVSNPAAVNVKFSWFPTEDNTGNDYDVSAKALAFSSLDRVTWTPIGTQQIVAGMNPRSITVAPTGGTYFTVGNSNTPLPVELSAFTASTSGKKVTLNWHTATEKNNYGFDIERRAAAAPQGTAGAWQKVAFVEGNGTSNAAHDYAYTDAVSAGKFEYRLKQTDRNGAFGYSKTIEAAVAFSAEDYAVSQNYPNPFNPTTNIRFAVKTAQHAVVKIFNAIGQEVRTLFNETAQPETMYSLTFDATGLPSGSYYYMLRTQDRSEVKRMLLVK